MEVILPNTPLCRHDSTRKRGHYPLVNCLYLLTTGLHLLSSNTVDRQYILHTRHIAPHITVRRRTLRAAVLNTRVLSADIFRTGATKIPCNRLVIYRRIDCSLAETDPI
jgi:hypothetical protein